MTDPSPEFAEVFNGADLPQAVISAKTGAELLDVSERQWHRLVQRGFRGSTLHPDFRPFSESASSTGAGLKAATAKALWWHVCNKRAQY